MFSPLTVNPPPSTPIKSHLVPIVSYNNNNNNNYNGSTRDNAITKRQTRISSLEDLLNPKDPQIRQDIIRMILQYLHDEGFNTTRITLHDEANVKAVEWEDQNSDARKIKKAILEGDWIEVDKLCQKSFMRNQKSLLYAVYKQQYLELVENHDMQKAFSFLNKRLKPLEHMESVPNEFHDLCYLLTCSNINDAPTLKHWDGIISGREKLVEQFQNIMQLESIAEHGVAHVPPGRLLQLLRQAIAHQIESGKYHPNVVPKISTLLYDYQTLVIPNACKFVMVGHKNNVKCVEWVGQDGSMFASGSSDSSIRLWDSSSGVCIDSMIAHTSKVWDCSSNLSGSNLATCGGDGCAKIWDLRHSKFNCIGSFPVSAGDLYSVKFHQSERHVVTGGYDKFVRLLDISHGSIVKAFPGHELSISSCIFNPYGNLIISGSKDNSIKFWDINSGLCVKTISTHLGEVTSVDINSSGSYLLSTSKDNSIRLWDIRMVRPIRRFKGYQNTSKNFIRASFASSSLVVSGSEDGRVHVWDMEKGDPLQRLSGHDGAVYMAAWNSSQNRWVSCSDDRTLRLWWFDESQIE